MLIAVSGVVMLSTVIPSAVERWALDIPTRWVTMRAAELELLVAMEIMTCTFAATTVIEIASSGTRSRPASEDLSAA